MWKKIQGQREKDCFNKLYFRIMKKYSRCLIFIAFILFQSCDDVLEEDITDDAITVIAPLDGTALEGNVVQFRWNALDGADEYRIQITGEQQLLVLDSLINKTVFDYQINPGQYQWRVRGENFAYVTPYTFPSNFTVAASMDLSGQTITLKTPANNVYFNDPSINFSWKGIDTADFYYFQVFKVEGSNEVLVFEDDNVLDTSMVVSKATFTDDAEYVWQVSAENEISATAFFKRNFFMDRQNPPAPNLLKPTSGQNFSTTQEVDFEWNFDDIGTVQSNITGTLEISPDENFANIVLTDTNANGQYTNTFSTAGTFYWRVRGEDEAGNIGDYNSTGNFIIN